MSTSTHSSCSECQWYEDDQAEVVFYLETFSVGACSGGVDLSQRFTMIRTNDDVTSDGIGSSKLLDELNVKQL